MNSLVGYGVSSESEDEERGSFKKTDSTGEEMKSRNFLLESESPSSESESGPDNEDEEEVIKHSSLEPLRTPTAHPHTHKLPPPPLGGFGSGGVLSSSVFTNPFKEMADERLHVLQKHVPLTLQARPTQIGGKRICLTYRKSGRCRFGSSCKFAHDSDLQNNRTVTSDSAPKDNATASSAGTQEDSLGFSCDVDKEADDDDKDSERRKKKRVGVNDSLIPPKRALKMYARLSHP